MKQSAQSTNKYTNHILVKLTGVLPVIIIIYITYKEEII